MELRDFFQECPKVALGFSGGVDSAYLLYAALDHGAQVRPYFIKTAFQPQFELEDACRLCAQLGVELTVVELDVLQVPAPATATAKTAWRYVPTGRISPLWFLAWSAIRLSMWTICATSAETAEASVHGTVPPIWINLPFLPVKEIWKTVQTRDLR